MIILGSNSPRRQELLRLVVPEFEVHPATIDERALPVLAPKPYVASLAQAKGVALAHEYPDATIITADTMVSYQGQLLGKPKDAADAKRMLRVLSGKTHQVFTGLRVNQAGHVQQTVVETAVTFWPLDDAMIDDYLATGEYTDKAGAYGIQGFGARLVHSIDGDFYNVVGLPVSTLYRMLKF